MDQTQSHAQAQAEAKPQAEAQSQALHAELEAYVTPESFPSVVCREDVGHVCCCTTCTLLPIHDRWVPKYVN
jgi:hypothetical protein